MKSIFDLKLEDLTSYLEDNGYSKFFSKQIYDWIYKKRVFDFDKMSNLKLDLRELLNFYYAGNINIPDERLYFYQQIVRHIILQIFQRIC